MAKMRALRPWTGAEGRVRPGDEVEVDEARARELEGFVKTTGRVLTPSRSGDQEFIRERRVSARAVRVTDTGGSMQYEDKGGATVAERGGHAVTAVDATPKAREIAAAEGIDLTRVRGTGKAGRIRESDVRTVIRGGQ